MKRESKRLDPTAPEGTEPAGKEPECEGNEPAFKEPEREDREQAARSAKRQSAIHIVSIVCNGITTLLTVLVATLPDVIATYISYVALGTAFVGLACTLWAFLWSRALLKKETDIRSQDALINAVTKTIASTDTTAQDLIFSDPEFKLGDSYDFKLATIARSCFLNMQQCVKSCYDAIQLLHEKTADKELVGEYTDFNLTVNFMTKSWKNPGHINIAIWQNYQQQEPSGRQEVANGGEKYDNDHSEAGKVYQAQELGEDKPKYPVGEITVISDTQKSNLRIEIEKEDTPKMKSMLIIPILSSKRNLLGVLIVHCNQKNFFSKKLLSLYRALFRLYIKDLQREKMLFDALIEKPGTQDILLTHNKYKQFGDDIVF